MPTLKRIGPVLWVTVAMLIAAPALADEEMTAAEFAMLPRWCAATMGNANTPERQAEFQRMINTYGHAWNHMHHYCYAKLNLARAERTFPRQMNGERVQQAIRDMDYVLRNSDASFTPRADILATKARTQARYLSADAAAQTAALLINEFPTYPDGYTILADVLLKNNHRDEALKILEKGEQAVSDKERFNKLRSILKLN